MRPELHRYCARMTGSVIEGEDVVQDTLARAYFELSQLNELPALRAWLFRIAHHRALDHLRHRQRSREQALDDRAEVPASSMDSDAVLEQSESVGVAIARFLELPPAQRGCVVLKDVLGHSLDETGLALEMTLPAVKAALHRGRARLRALAVAPEATPARAFHPTLARYAALFNARDWDGVRALLAADVKLDVVLRERRSGANEVGQYFGNYSRVHDWHARLVWLDGRSVIAMSRQDGPDYVIELSIETGRVTQIRDFRYVPYITQDAVFEPPLPTV